MGGTEAAQGADPSPDSSQRNPSAGSREHAGTEPPRRSGGRGLASVCRRRTEPAPLGRLRLRGGRLATVDAEAAS